MIKTECKSCIFAGQSNTGEQQCYFGRLEIFKKQGKLQENDHGYYTITRFCNLCRNQETIDQVYPGLDFDQIAEECRAYIVPHVDYVVLVDNDDMDLLNKTVDSIVKSNIEPSHVVFGINSTEVSAKEVYKATRRLHGSEVVFLFDEVEDQTKVIDASMKKGNGAFISLFMTGYEIPNNFIGQIDEIINDSLIMCPIITNNDGSLNGTTVVRSLFSYLGTFKDLITMTKGQMELDGIQEITWNQG